MRISRPPDVYVLLTRRPRSSIQKHYTVIEHEPIYVASDDKVSHSVRSGDLDRGKAWRSVKRPSDMVRIIPDLLWQDSTLIFVLDPPQNEYADEIREIRMREKPGRAHAKVFVKSASDSGPTFRSQQSFLLTCTALQTLSRRHVGTHSPSSV